MESRAERAGQGLPDRRLLALYFGFAHLCLLAAMAVVALDPRSVGGFFYHPRLLGVVHLVTLGWITGSILGALYLLGPLVLRAPLPRRRGDLWAFGLFSVGALGLVSHFWLDEPRGMVWAGALLVPALAWVGGRFSLSLCSSSLPAAVKAHFHLAFLNLLLAAALGLLAGTDKFLNVLPGYVLDNVFAHAHLAALGWATMTVMAAGYRLLPMLLPAAMPAGPSLWWSALLMEAGILGLAASLLAGREARLPWALLCLASISIFLSRVVWMVRRPRPPGRSVPRPDFGVGHVLFALFCLVGAAILGLVLLLSPPAAWEPRAALVYGTLGLVGFLSQMVIGVSSRLLPVFSWMGAFGGRFHRERPATVLELSDQRLRATVLALWLVGLPLLVAGLGFDRAGLIRLGAALLFAATAMDGLEQRRLLRR